MNLYFTMKPNRTSNSVLYKFKYNAAESIHTQRCWLRVQELDFRLVVGILLNLVLYLGYLFLQINFKRRLLSKNFV